MNKKQIIGISIFVALIVLIVGIKAVTGSSDDARKKNKGLSCYSFDTSKLTKYFSEIENDENRRHFCNILLPILCTHVIETHQEKKIINPFTTSVEESDD